MEHNNFFAILDIGTYKIACLIGRESDNGRMEVLGYSKTVSTGVCRGNIVNIKETAAAITKSIQKAKLGLDNIDVRNVYVNIAGANLHTIERSLEKSIKPGSIISEESIKRLQVEASQVELPEGYIVYSVIPQSYVIDGEEIDNPIGSTGQDITAIYQLVIAPESYRNNIVTCLDMAGLTMVKCVANPIAASEVVLSDDEREGGVALVDFGAGTSSIAIYFEGTLRYSSVIPFGGNLITKDIREGCAILPQQAESLKVQFGEAMGSLASDIKVVKVPGIDGRDSKDISFKTLAYIIQARVEEFFEFINHEIKKSGYEDNLAAGIVLTGNGARLKNLTHLANYSTGLDARIGFPMVKLPKEQEEQLDSPEFATAFGLLKMAMNDANATNSELIVKKEKKKKKEHSGIKAVTQIFSSLFVEEQGEEI